MSLKLTVTLLTLAIGVVMAPVSAEARTRGDCSKQGSRTVMVNDNARVFSIPRRISNPRVDGGRAFSVDLFYGCLSRSGKRSFLGGNACGLSFGAVQTVRLAGAYVAYSRDFCESDSTSASVSVTSLRSGRRTRVLPAFTHPAAPPAPCPPGLPCPGSIGPGSGVANLKLKANGSVAWIGKSVGELYELQVRKADRSGPNVLLDSGGEIDPDSLRLSRDAKTIHWIKRRSPVSAPLH